LRLVQPPASELATVEPGGDIRLGSTHVYRLTIGHLVGLLPADPPS